MIVVNSATEMQGICRDLRSQSEMIGLVPTMGYFHEGHLSLMREAKQQTGIVVTSLFVNPTQFGPAEDLRRYPRDFERDKEMAEAAGVDYLFTPSEQDMYPAGYRTHVEVDELGDVLCGTSRPGHFRGVATVVAKLFQITQPHRAFFGEKDAQQLIIIRRMARDLNFQVEIVGLPIVRESDGLAMSSRNVYLDSQQRKDATVLWRSLSAAKEMVESGERRSERILTTMRSMIQSVPSSKIDYVTAVDTENLQPLDTLTGNAMIAVAVWIGNTRLIDNIQFRGL